jgi:hypothetical protein
MSVAPRVTAQAKVLLSRSVVFVMEMENYVTYAVVMPKQHFKAWDGCVPVAECLRLEVATHAVDREAG